jgi:NAD(P)-dependent dehydrogenase (short-subunit alcohol dehydrogenase family)
MSANEVALVTGGNKGLGHEIVRQLAERGMTVYLGARDEIRGREAAAALACRGCDVRFVGLDVTVPESVATAVNTIEAERGGLDVLVNNAGIAVEIGTAVLDITAAQLRATYEVNVLGAVTVTSACVPLLRKSANGRIVNMSSRLGSLACLSAEDSAQRARGALAYSSSKAALNVLTLLYAEALRTDGIQVNAATPGRVATDINAATPWCGVRTPAEGAVAPVYLATLPRGTMTGKFCGPGIDDSPGW